MPESTVLESVYTFRGIDYVITMQTKSDTLLTVTVEDRLTANQWKGTFDSTYVEDMTHKTGNYKQFHVFINMLESAITQTSDSVTMDLLTFSDLELLRKRKAGVGTQNIPGASNSSLTQKRYLILTYAVEFDKIHYPLPLPYAGKPDPELLQETIRRLQTEIKSLKTQESKDYRIRELEKLKIDYDQLLSEKEAVEQEYILYRKELKHTSVGASTKEIRILKGVVKNLEEELMKEKSKHQRAAAKRRKEYQDLLEEVTELRASERTLKVRLKSITNELAVYKRKAIQAEHGGSKINRQSNSRVGNTSRGSAASFTRDRSLSRDRGRSMSADRRPSSVERRPSSSRYNDRLVSPQYERRTSSRADTRSRNSFGRTPSPSTRLKPSPAGTRKPRFDPTAYITEKKNKEASRTRSSPGVNNYRHRSEGSQGHTRGVRSSPNLNSYPRRSSIDRPRSEGGATRRVGGAPVLHTRDRSRERVSRSRERITTNNRVRTSSVESLGSVGSARRSRTNSYNYNSDVENRSGSIRDGDVSDSGSHRGHRGSRQQGGGRNVAWGAGDSPVDKRYTTSRNNNVRGKSRTPNTSTPNPHRLRSRENIPMDTETDYHNRSADIDDIDARLQRIQEMMKNGI